MPGVREEIAGEGLPGPGWPPGPPGPAGPLGVRLARLSALGASGPRFGRSPGRKGVGGGMLAAGWMSLGCGLMTSCTGAPLPGPPTTAPVTPTVPFTTRGSTETV